MRKGVGGGMTRERERERGHGKGWEGGVTLWREEGGWRMDEGSG